MAASVTRSDTLQTGHPVQSIARVAACRAAIPVAGLLLLGVFLLLWTSGAHHAYFTVLRFFGAEPFTFPFLDTQAVLSAIECHHRGVNVYISNPCNVLLRRFDYSPLWLAPSFARAKDTPFVGLALDVAFILSLTALFRPRSMREIVVPAVVVFSPTTLFALERANGDVLVFLLVLAASVVGYKSFRHKKFSYLLIIVASLLKYYPFVLLVTIGRESRRTVIFPVLGATTALLIFVLFYRGELLEALAVIPRGSYFDEAFWALNLPFGIAGAFAGHEEKLFGAALLTALIVATAINAWRFNRLLSVSAFDWERPELRCLAAASWLVPACFFASQNIAYRGIFLLLAVPGLLSLRTGASSTATRRWLGRMIAAVAFIMWGKFFRYEFQYVWPASIGTPAWVGFWFARELIWWWLIGGLLSLAASYFRALPLVCELLAGATWFHRAPAG